MFALLDDSPQDEVVANEADCACWAILEDDALVAKLSLADCAAAELVAKLSVAD